MQRVLRIAAAACLLAVTVVAPAAAAKPAMERVPIDEVHILDEFLTDVCGFDVFVDAHGHITFRELTAGEATQRELNNYAIRITYSSAWASVNAVDVGVDRVAYLEDGSAVQVIIGNVQSLTVPGQGRVHVDVGQQTFHVTFDEFGVPSSELISSHGQHDGNFDAVICEALAG
jgi:hypothetical protein